ncbi:OLC1v1028451C2 [Oldenlandia corymbosa var. corymbosa]|uniref:OLC1v1028451C2 n=1 Tax=Oldenlandia corymbosa var. corymbosa TaxID=529605 RepID=A0AAV1CCX9_OLDCO|nr:OLC1v1028451C2 [Oldenlandia corymbosa var. corymbosa]
MLGEGDRERLSASNRKTYSRSVSWTGRSPAQSNSKPQWNSKARACLPPLQPLSITRPAVEEWPKPGSDDLGIWNSPPTPSVRPGSITPRENSVSGHKTPREFEFKKDKLAFFNKECSRIVDYIYLGSDTIAKDREVLRQNGITHVLNCVGFLCPEYFKGDLIYKTLWLQDSPSEDITSILYDVFDYFEEVREQGGRVFVHCCQGVSRSTSLVIAYLMWKQGQSFEDAFQHVKAARGVTNPNMGFACQLLQCQKRVHALPASPSSVIRMYRMAPHSPYDPLHLVPKLLNEPGAEGLDSRGAFIVHVPSAIYVWIGKQSVSVMSDAAKAAANQVIHYEKAKGPVIMVKEGDEPSEFWVALRKDGKVTVGSFSDGIRSVPGYDLDFEIFQKALAGGVVPPFQLSGTGSETHLPARQNGWNRLRWKFASGIMKEFITSTKSSFEAVQTDHGQGDESNEQTFGEPEDTSSPVDRTPPSSPQCDSPLAFPPYVAASSNWIKHSSPLDNLSLSPFASRAKSDTTSPSLSPSTSDYSSSFTFSPTSSNWSDLSCMSTQPSPSELESKNLDLHCSDASLEESAPLLCDGVSSPTENVLSGSRDLRMACFPSRGRSVSLAERRGNIPPPRMRLHLIDEASQVPVGLTRSWSFTRPDLDDEMITEADCNKGSVESSSETSREETMTDADIFVSDDEAQSGDQDELSGTHYLSNLKHGLSLYRWPSLHKVERCHGVLDSTSVYMMFVPGTSDKNVLYVWLGHGASSEGGRDSDSSSFKDIEWERVGHDFIAQKGYPTTSLIQIVKEGEEPELLSKHLPCFSFQDMLDTGIQ